MVSVSHGLRSWDIAHPRLWGTAINENRVPWADSETITPEENLEELIMLGLRLHEGLDLDRINRAINDAGMSSTPQTLRNVSLDQLAPMVSEGLITVSDNHRVVPTRRGRLLNDSVIEQFFISSVYESVVWCAAVAITCSLVVVTPSEGAIFVLPAGEGTA